MMMQTYNETWIETSKKTHYPDPAVRASNCCNLYRGEPRWMEGIKSDSVCTIIDCNITVVKFYFLWTQTY
jgi:hypothetical protein